MKHLCKNCINCERISRDFGYETACSLQRSEVLGRVKQCKYYEKKYLTLQEGLDLALECISQAIENMKNEENLK